MKLSWYSFANVVACVRCSKNFLLGEVGLVFVVNSKILETIQLVGLDPLHLETLVLNSLTNLAALFQVVKSILLLNI